MKAHEHRAIGDEATGGALVDLTAGATGAPFVLRYGDVIALSGDFFPADDLFALAGDGGGREEIVCALRVMAVDEAADDPRFRPGGEFGTVAAGGDVERRVRDRFLTLAAANADHFVDPWGGAPAGGRTTVPSRFPSAATAYRRLHETALEEACRLGRLGADVSGAMAREAAAQHYLTDAFAAGHVRTPIAAIRRYWHDRYPRFWERLQTKVAADTAVALRELSRTLRLLPRRVVYDKTLAAVRARTASYPAISLGDLLGRVFHDWDNDHGLVLEDGGMLFGDGHLDEGVGRRLAVSAVRAGIVDVEVAFDLGASGSTLSGEGLFRAVRNVTGAGASAFRAESHLPRLSPGNHPLNWHAADIDELWASPIAGDRGPTVGEAVAAVLEVGGEVSRRLDCLGQGVVEAFDVLNVPLVRDWLARKACHAYHRGFIEGLARDPKGSVCAVANVAGGATSQRAPTSPAPMAAPACT